LLPEELQVILYVFVEGLAGDGENDGERFTPEEMNEMLSTVVEQVITRFTLSYVTMLLFNFFNFYLVPWCLIKRSLNPWFEIVNSKGQRHEEFFSGGKISNNLQAASMNFDIIGGLPTLLPYADSSIGPMVNPASSLLIRSRCSLYYSILTFQSLNLWFLQILTR
jgi:hypothetical protein